MSYIFFDGYDGVKLQCKYHRTHSDVLVVVVHPHPLYGGTMDTKVVFSSYKVARGLGFNVLRYNSRGVSLSEGRFDNGISEAKDLVALVKFKFATENLKYLYVVGFSFGCYVLFRAINGIDYELKKFIMIAPPSNLFDFSGSGGITKEGLIIQGTEDDIVPVCYTDDLVKGMMDNINYLKIEGAGHFFDGYELYLSSAITSFLQK